MNQNRQSVCDPGLRRALQDHCLQCSDDDWQEVVNCQWTHCLLHAHRIEGLAGVTDSMKARRKAIQDFCFVCVGGSEKGRQACDADDCALFPYRNG